MHIFRGCQWMLCTFGPVPNFAVMDEFVKKYIRPNFLKHEVVSFSSPFLPFQIYEPNSGVIIESP